MAARGTSARWIPVTVLLFTVAWGTNHFAPLLLVYREHLGLSAIDVNFLFGVYAVGLLPGLLLGGPWSDRYGRRAVVLPSALFALGGTVLLANGGTGFAVLLAGRLVVGVGSGATFSAGTAWVQDLATGAPPGTGARRAAVALSSGFGGGPLVASIIAQWLPYPMVTPYVVHGGALLAAIVLAWTSTAQTSPSKTTSAAPAPAPAPARLPTGFFREIAPVAPWVFVFPSTAFAVLPGLVRDRLGGLAVAYAGLVTATTLLTGVLVQPALRRYAPRRIATLGLVSGALGLVGGLYAASRGSPALLLVAAMLLGTGYGALLIAGLRWVEASTTAATRGRVMGVYYVFTYLGFAAPLLLATLARRHGDSFGLYLTSGLAFVTAAYTSLRPWRSEGGAAARDPLE